MERRQWFLSTSDKADTRNPTVGPNRLLGHRRGANRVMGIDLFPAMKMALDRAASLSRKSISSRSMKLSACQYLAWKRNLNLNRTKVMSMAGPSPSVILRGNGNSTETTLIYEFKRRNARYGLGSACIGGGRGSLCF